ncbi:LisH dimerization motif-containing protein [Artemisia annua]|uniref:LisH dimerization motif-containing protein n=1 Tax=Artemisia annua TaxID=35608 RepID=A0A2U1P7T1_ARTAN|nr:LisH dimerization motif-containing protein [Artemisia annua]
MTIGFNGYMLVAIMAVGASKPTAIADKDGYFSVKSQMTGHTKPVYSIFWDTSGEYLASLSDDSVRIWCMMSRNEGECVHDLSCNENKFHLCIFHPSYASLLVIGCHQLMSKFDL